MILVFLHVTGFSKITNTYISVNTTGIKKKKKKKKDSSNLNTEMRLNLQNSAVPTATVSARFLI